MQPDDRRSRLGLERVGDLADELGAEAEASGREATELQETTTRNAVTTHDVVKRLLGMHCNSPFLHGCDVGWLPAGRSVRALLPCGLPSILVLGVATQLLHDPIRMPLNPLWFLPTAFAAGGWPRRGRRW